MTHARFAIVASLCAACSGAARPVAVTQARGLVARPVPRSSAVPSGPVWERIAPRELPLPIVDIGALAGTAAVVVAGGALFRVDVGAPTPVCTDFSTPPRMIQAEGERFVAFGGTDAEPIVWRSLDRGVHCDRVRLPTLMVRDAVPAAGHGLTLDGDVALAWTSNGGVAWSHDTGATWRRIADLPNVIDVFRAHDDTLIAAARNSNNPLHYAESVHLYRIEHPEGGLWEPLSITPERRYPLQLTRETNGDLVILDPLGTVRLAPDGTVRAEHPEPALRSPDERIRVAVPAGPARFLVATERMLVGITESSFEPFAPFDATSRLAIDANAEGVVWLTRPEAIFRGTLGHVGLEAVIVAPRFHGAPLLLAASGDSLALVSAGLDVALSTDAGRRWRNVHLDGVTDPTGVAFDARGDVLVVGGPSGEPATLAVTDGEAVVRMVPRERAGVAPRGTPGEWVAAAAVASIGERWIVVDGGVFTSDDEGAHWSHRARGDDEATVITSAFHGASMVVLDTAARLWRSDDAASSFRLLGAFDPVRHLVALTLPLHLTWDGAQTITISARDRYLRSSDGGATWASTATGAEALSPSDLLTLPDGRLLARSNAPRLEIGPLLIEDVATHRFNPIDDAALHPAAAIALDGPWLYVAGAEGSVTRADTRQLRYSSDHGTRDPLRFRPSL